MFAYLSWRRWGRKDDRVFFIDLIWSRLCRFGLLWFALVWRGLAYSFVCQSCLVLSCLLSFIFFLACKAITSRSLSVPSSVSTPMVIPRVKLAHRICSRGTFNIYTTVNCVVPNTCVCRRRLAKGQAQECLPTPYVPYLDCVFIFFSILILIFFKKFNPLLYRVRYLVHNGGRERETRDEVPPGA